MDLHVRYESDDDPKKHMAKKLEHFDMAVFHGSDCETPYDVVLNPHADRALSSVDADAGAFVALDCSWESAGEAMFSLPGEHRTSPYFVTANPMSPGRLVQLTTVEAIAVALVILGEKKRAEDVLSKFNWDHAFLEPSEEPLRRYVACADLIEAVGVQREYLGRGE